METKNLNEEFYGVNEIHTLMVPDEKREDGKLVYVGMNVQGTVPGDKEFVMVFTVDQVMEIYDYMIEQLIKQA